MNVELNLSESAQAALQHYAAVTGKSVDALIQEAVEYKLSELDATTPTLTADEWSVRLRSWAASQPVQRHFVDDSRESIYAGRGE